MRMDQTGGLLQRSNGSGSFSLAYFHSTPKGKRKERSKVISESGVKLQFLSNQFGVFEIHGTAVGSKHEGDPAFNVELRKKYKASPNAAPAPAPGRKNASRHQIQKRVSAGSTLDARLLRS
mmetsp:Transcript_6583/g.8705  ORF Transcript_6583/g.8705 Transcript_6583/m.8705 type:complete len:121 (+) Transcript_6583:163-525(+)